MAQMIFFHYMHKDTIIHQMDGRVKLFCMLLLSLSISFASQWQHYAIPLCLIIATIVIAKLPIIDILKEIKLFAVIIMIVFVSNAFAIPGDPISGFPIESVSIQGVIRGGHFAGRLILIILISIIVFSTTSLLTYKKVIEWYLRPIPFIREVRIATMINLIFMMIPIIFDNYKEMMEAQMSRGIELQKKNPLRRLKFIAFPLLSRTLQRADEIVYAMESRCYCEIRTKTVFKANKSDWVILVICVVVFFFVIV